MERLHIYLFLLAITFGCANAARILDEESPQIPLPAPNVPQPSDQTTTDNPEIAPPLVAPSATGTPTVVPTESAAPVIPPVVDAPDVETDPVAAIPAIASPSEPATPVMTPPAGAATASTTTTTSAATVGNPIPEHSTLSFFMHDILGGSHPSGRVVTGIVAKSDVNPLPFTKPNNQIFPMEGGVPLNTINNALNQNNYPFLAGLNGSPANTNLQNAGNNNIVSGGNNQAFVSAGQLPAGVTLQNLMFGSVTVVDNEITEGHELGSAVLGKAQGFYLASSADGSTHTLALTALFHTGGEHDHEIVDTISFFGIHRTATPISHIAIIGGTGKYENANGYATIETLPHVDQHTTDGVETITQFTVYITP